MARLPRLYVPGCAHHMIQRGNNRTTCFYRPQDYTFYLDELAASADEFGVAIHAYVLMTNHVHLLATPETAQSCGRMMQSLGRKYVKYFNDMYRRTGTLWEGRYKSTLVDSDRYLLTVSRYIELNPVRAGIVPKPLDYPWSSYADNALKGYSKWLTQHPLYRSLGETPGDRARQYRGMFEQPIPVDTLEDIRQCTNKAWALGSEQFKVRISQQANRPVESSGWGGDRRSPQSQSRGQTP